ADLRAMASAFRATLLSHPNATPLFASRPAVTPGSLRYVEMGLSVLSDPFPDLAHRVQAFQAVVAFIVGNAMLQLAPPAVNYRTLSEEAYPILADVGRTLDDYTAQREFEFGLDAVIHGLAAMRDSAGSAR
ncbi:MAG: TetR/AcrR family transcriptional regulator C-terminal domain-containing protein, partial [Myxococcota bacterium]